MQTFGSRKPHAKTITALGVLALVVSACTVTTPAAITSTQGVARALTSVQLLSEQDETGLRSQFANEITQSFGSRGVTLNQSAPFVADFAVSQRPAELGLQAISESSEEGQAPKSDFKSRWYDKCKPSRVSASLVIYSRASGTVQAKSSGEFLTCPGDLSQLNDLAQILVDRALTN